MAVVGGLAAGSEGLVAHWRFDKVVGGDAWVDISGQRLAAQAQSGVEYVKDGGREFLKFDGLDQGLEVRSTNFFKLSEQITTMVWLKAAHLRGHTVIFGIPNANPEWTTPAFGMYASGGFIVYGQFGDKRTPKALIESSKPLALHEWVCVTVTSDGERLKCYVDGELDGELAQRAILHDSGNPLLVGWGYGNNKRNFKGLIGELRIYNRALAAAEVQALFKASVGEYQRDKRRSIAADGTVVVETHGSNPDTPGSWRQQATRLLDLLDGYQRVGEAPRLSKYGGALDLPRSVGSGFFRVAQVDGRWWLIDPEGYRFINVGLSTVSLPKDVNENFGSTGRWVQELTDQLRGTGFNGLGNNSHTNLQSVKEPLCWVLRHNFLFSFARHKRLHEPASGTYGFPNRCMPVFHPEFPAWCEEYGKELQKTANDPLLLGIMTENEIQCPWDMLDRFLALEQAEPDMRHGYTAAVAWLKARKGVDDIKEVKLTRSDRYQFIAYAFEYYYKVVVPIVRKNDPNHLYLGSRINYGNGQFDNPWFWRMLPKYHDVVSVNYYARWGADRGEMEDWTAWANLPIIFTEWYAKALDVQPKLANTHGAGWVVRTQEDRARYYQHFALAALETPIVVGWHFFKYRDDPPEAKALDNFGGANKGMYDIYGKPHLPLLQSSAAVNREKYALIEFFDRRRVNEESIDFNIKPTAQR